MRRDDPEQKRKWAAAGGNALGVLCPSPFRSLNFSLKKHLHKAFTRMPSCWCSCFLNWDSESWKWHRGRGRKKGTDQPGVSWLRFPLFHILDAANFWVMQPASAPSRLIEQSNNQNEKRITKSYSRMNCSFVLPDTIWKHLQTIFFRFC